MKIALILLGILPADTLIAFFNSWSNDGFRAVGTFDAHVHRVDHVVLKCSFHHRKKTLVLR